MNDNKYEEEEGLPGIENDSLPASDSFADKHDDSLPDLTSGKKEIDSVGSAENKGLSRFEANSKGMSATGSSPKDIKSAAIKKSADAALKNAPESVQKAAETAQKASSASTAVTSTVGSIKASASAAIALLSNPATWIVLAVALVVALGLTGIVAGTQTVGRNENADGCYGVVGGSTSFVMDESADGAARGNTMASWLMSNPFEFLGNKPMTKNQAIGIIGNFMQESQVTFARAEHKDINLDGRLNKASNEEVEKWTKEGTTTGKDRDPRGLGLAQWTWNPGRAGNLIELARSMGKQWYDAEVQLELIKAELDTSYGDMLIAQGFDDPAKTIEELVTIFHDVYEGSADANMDARHKAAKDFEAVFTGIASGSSSGGSCVVGAGNVDTSSAVGLAISLSYETTAESYVYPSDTYGKSKAKPEYIAAKEKAEETTGKDPVSSNLFASCDRFVATVVRLTLDPTFPWGDTTALGKYLLDSDKWQQYTTKSEAQPGDVWVTKSKGHVIMYIGEYNGVDSIAHASYMERVAGIGSANYLSENLVDTNGRAYYGYRFVG